MQAARGLRLGVDVWKKFEDGMIELVSLSERQLERLARFFHVSAEQFCRSTAPEPARAQRWIAARPPRPRAAASRLPAKQSFAEAIEKSAMSKEEQASWLEEA